MENMEKYLYYEVDNRAENTLSFFAVVVLVVGIIGGLVLIAYAVRIESPIFIVVAISEIVCLLISWAVIKVFVNISKTLKEINCRLSHMKD